MDTIIGLGSAGCNIAMKFSDYPQYKTICIDTQDDNYENFIRINRQASHEDYERSYTRLDLSGVVGSPTLIVGGSGLISGVSLRILEQIRDENSEMADKINNLSHMLEESHARERRYRRTSNQYQYQNNCNVM